jgi:hypothetical protein
MVMNNRGQAMMIPFVIGIVAIIAILFLLPNLTNFIEVVVTNFYIIVAGIFLIGFIVILFTDEEKRPKGLSNKVLFASMGVALAVTIFLAIGISPVSAFIGKSVANYNASIPVEITVHYNLQPPPTLIGYSYGGVTISSVSYSAGNNAPLSIVPILTSLIPYNYNSGVLTTLNLNLNCDQEGKIYSQSATVNDIVSTSSYKFVQSFNNVPNSISCTLSITCITDTCTNPVYTEVIQT